MKITQFNRRPRGTQIAFTLIELMVAIAIMILLLLMVFSMVDQTQRTWSRASAQANQFRDARVAFETITRRLRQADLNTYWDYKFDNRDRPETYIRQSELHFISGPTAELAKQSAQAFPTHGVFFQAPFGYTANPEYQQFTDMMNAWGYFIEYSDEADSLPEFISKDPRFTSKFRYRLKEFRLPTEELEIYEEADARRDEHNSSTDNAWFASHIGNQDILSKRIVAENIIALVLTPMKSMPDGTATDADLYYPLGYTYDSRIGVGDSAGGNNTDPLALAGANVHMLPSLIRVTMVAIDEKSAEKLAMDSGGTPPDLIQTGWFQTPFSNKLEADLELLTQDFNNRRINYRVFTTMIAMRAATWAKRN